MATKFQVAIDCADAARLVRFWAEALHYQVEPPPAGFETWNAYWRSIGVSEDELDDSVDAADSIIDPAGVGPRIVFLIVPEGKTVKNRLHFDLDAGGGRSSVPLATRKPRVLAEEQRARGLLRAELSATSGQRPCDGRSQWCRPQ